MARLEFFFDCSSPWTWLGFEGVIPLAQRTGVTIEWRPFLVGGVFNTVNPSVYEGRANPVPVKQAYYEKDMADWAARRGVVIGKPPVFPVNSVKAMRGAFLAIEAGNLVDYARRVFRTYWTDLQDISQDAVMAGIAKASGFDPAEFLERIAQPDLKARLRANTDELMARGGFGSPTMFVNGTDMYFGNDRLELVEAALRRAA